MLIQYPSAIRSFSSEYGPPYSNTQVHNNLRGCPPDVLYYDDLQYVGVFRSYGDWLNACPSKKQYSLFNIPEWFQSTEFIECVFNYRVVPHKIEIYQNFFPGSICKIIGTEYLHANQTSNKWITLWSGQSQTNSNKYTIFSEYIFIESYISINRIRIEFDCFESEYYNQIEAIKLTGTSVEHYQAENNIISDLDRDDLLTIRPSTNNEKLLGHHEPSCIILCHFKGLVDLPKEILFKILCFLSLDELCRISRVNKLFNELSKDPTLYINVNLQPFYNLLTDSSIISFSSKFNALQRLILSWVGVNNQISTLTLCKLLRNIPNVTELRLNASTIVASSVLETIAIYCPNIKVLDLSYCNNSLQLCVSWLTTLKHLTYLNIAHTLVTTSELLLLLSKLENLKWFLAGSPTLLANQDSVIDCLSQKTTKLKGVDLWHWNKISFSMMCQFLHYHGSHLLELDLGFCMGLSHRDILPIIADSCYNLEMLCLSSLHGTNDASLRLLAKNCGKLMQLDVLGSRHVTFTGVHDLLVSSTQLKLLDISYCDHVSVEDVIQLQTQFPDVKIKHVATFVSQHS